MSKRTSKSPTPRTAALGQLFEDLSSRILGQTEVLERLSRAVQRLELGGVPPGGCARCFLFAGPTGVGKTETAQNLADLVFGPDHFIRFDCAEFKTLDRVGDLLGNRSGDPGRFQQAYGQASRGVWLFDEIEKAHPEFVHLFLAMTEANRVTLASGDTLDLSGLYIVVTSNLGSAEILGREHLPFVSLEKRVVRSIERHFRPELLRRFGPPYVFRPLGRAAQEAIVALHLKNFIQWHASRGRTLVVGPEVARYLAVVGFSPRLGAGPLLAAIHQCMGDAVTENLLAGGTGSGRVIVHGDHLKLVAS